MISIRKLYSLKYGTRQRKIISLLKTFETETSSKHLPDVHYLNQLIHAAENLESLSQSEREDIQGITVLPDTSGESIKRTCNTLRHLLLKNIHAEPAEWDLLAPGDSKSGTEERKVLPFFLYLDDIRSPFNVGSIFRTAESFGVRKILLSKDTASPNHPRAQRSAMGCINSIPWEIVDERNLPQLPTFALELGGTSVSEFSFPVTGLLIIGSEELGVSPRLLARAEASLGRVSLSTGGLKGSINVSVAFGIMQYFWYTKIIGGEPAQFPLD